MYLKLYQEDNRYRVDISVRQLVEFVLREGSIDNRISEQTELNAMLKGAETHRRTQAKMGLDYQSEISLKQVLSFDAYDIYLEGRADGIIKNDDGIVIDEIKSVFIEPEGIEKEKKVHLAQAICYAYMYSVQNNLNKCSVQISYVNVDDLTKKVFLYEYKAEELTDFFESLISELSRWIEYKIKWIAIRTSSIEKLSFPYDYREGQKRLVKSVYLTIKAGKKIFVEAATGIGKTIATIYPTVKCIGSGEAGRMFYLTSKTVTGIAAVNAFSLLYQQGLKIKSLMIVAREKVCFMSETDCNPNYCKYADGFYDRINDLLYEFINSNDCFDRETIRRFAEKNQICPYYLSLELAKWCNVIIGDYNYVFSPDVRLQSLFENPTIDKDVVLIDEAHNLVDRARDMYSAVLVKEEVLKARRLIKEYSPKIYKKLSVVNNIMLEHKNNPSERPEFDKIIGHLEYVFQDLSAFFEKSPDEELNKELLEFYFMIRRFLLFYEPEDPNYTYYEEEGEDGFQMKIFCVNPSEKIKECVKNAVGTVFFSATLLPIDYFKSLLGYDDGDYEIYAGSPFDPEKRKIIIANDVTSKYTSRNVYEYNKICGYIMDTVNQKKGNYIVFFPSYKFMLDVFDVFKQHYDNEEINWVVQSKVMMEEDREIFLENFYEDNDKTLIGFCVMGSLFSEGIDLVGDRLIGALIIGTGIPQVSNETNLLKEAYDELGFNGFDYAFRYPGLNKVLQAGGRVIRTEDDAGVIVLLDSRFLQRSYRELLPVEWKKFTITDRINIKNVVKDFWNGGK